MTESSSQSANVCLGTVLDRFEMTIEAGKVREFARAVGDIGPAHYEPDPPVPLTFVATAAFWGRDAADLLTSLGLDLSRALHGEEEFRYELPLAAGMRLHAETRLVEQDERDSRRGGKIRRFVLQTTYTGPTGQTVLVQRRTILETETSFGLQR
jgi:acyl dehydratase